MVLTDSTGNRPEAVSPEEHDRVGAVRMALATSSFRPGSAGMADHRFDIWVAVITGLPALLQARMIFLDQRTFRGDLTPGPLATMTASSDLE
jgi:hypothetical protein